MKLDHHTEEEEEDGLTAVELNWHFVSKYMLG